MKSRAPATGSKRMRTGVTRRVILAACLLPALRAPARAEEDDQDAARQALQAGRAVPLERVLQRAQREHPGHLLGVELVEEDGRLIYQIRILGPGGRLDDWRYDADTTAPLAGQRKREAQQEGGS